jgi:ATP-dependent RNA helicase DeaD
MTTEFTTLNLRPELEQAITALGYSEPTPIQAGIIPLMLTGTDVIGQAQTGTGKTAAFALPILNNLKPSRRLPQALILAPTRELALQVSEAFNELGKFCNVRVLAVYGGAPYNRQIMALQRGVDVVVGTPGRLIDLMERKSLDLHQVHTVVLDEADEMLSMGFIEDIETILATTPEERQTALFSATLPSAIRRLAEKYMRDPQPVTIQREQVTVAATEQRYYLVNEKDKTAALTRLFEIENITSALIFVRTRLGTGDLAGELTKRGFPSEAINGDLNQEARERTLNRFRQGQVRVLVATDVAARGLDIDNISHVFNYDLPDEAAEIYVHRIGRTGRAGKTGIAISLVTPREKRRLREIESFTRQKLTRCEVPTLEQIQERRQEELLSQVQLWLQRGRCKQERALVETLVASGTDPLDIAAAALKIARGGEKQRPIAPMSEVVEHIRRETRTATGPRREAPAGRGGTRRTSHDRGGAAASHEEGMVRLTMNLGRQHGIRPSDVVGAIAYHADIPGSTIGKIFIEDRHTFVDVPENLVGQVLARSDRYSIRRQTFTVERAG